MTQPKESQQPGIPQPDAARPAESTPSTIIDARRVLSGFYGAQDVIYVDTVMRNGKAGDKRISGVGTFVVSEMQATRPHDPTMIDGFFLEKDEKISGLLGVKPDHARGHLNTENGHPLIFPGHKQIRFALETIRMGEVSKGTVGEYTRIKSIDRVNFRGGVMADNSTTLNVLVSPNEKTDDASESFDIKIEDQDQKVTANMDGFQVSSGEKPEGSVLLEDQLLEAAAQALLVTTVDLDKLGDNQMPLFMSIYDIEFFGENLRPGDEVKIAVAGRNSNRGPLLSLTGQVTITSGDRLIATIGSLRGAIAEKSHILSTTVEES